MLVMDLDDLFSKSYPMDSRETLILTLDTLVRKGVRSGIRRYLKRMLGKGAGSGKDI